MPRSGTTTSGRVRWWVEGEPTPLLHALIEDLDRVLESPASVARERVGRKRFYRVQEPGGRPALYVKVFAAARGPSRLLSLVRPSKARREARTARRVAARGFRVALPLAVGEERHGGLLVRSISVIPDHSLRDLRARLEDPATDGATRRALVESFGRLNRRLHEAGVYQDDTSPNNFLPDDSDDTWTLIDFERCRLGRSLRRRRWRLLAKLHRHELGVSRTNRLRFLRSYLGAGAGRAERRSAWEKLYPEFLRVRRRDARRAATAAFRDGRNVARDGDEWYVRGREGSAVIRLHVGTAQSRAIWTLAHVFERLSLPCLRPVRLGAGSVDLEAPELDENAREYHAAVARARKRFAPYGSFVREPQWALTPSGAVLITPTAFKLRI